MEQSDQGQHCLLMHFSKNIYSFNLLYTSGLFHCYMLDESICRFRGADHCILVASSAVICWTSPFVILVYFDAFLLFSMENPVSKHCGP